MTTKQAIHLLHRLQDEQFDGEYGDERREALEMAVRALEGDGDMISRQQAIVTAVKAAIDWHRLANPQYSIAYCIGEAMRQLPSAQPQRKKGKWISEVKGKKAIIDEYGNVTCSAHCSECGDWLTGSDEYACRGRYCPNCGADMRTDGNDDN